MKLLGAHTGVWLLLGIWLTACAKEDNPATDPPSGGTGTDVSGAGTGADSAGTEGVGSSVPASSGSTTTGGQGGEPTEEVPTEPFVIAYGACRPNVLDVPEPIYEGGHFNATISSVTGTEDEVYFAESSSFDEIPPRIAKVTAAGTVETVLDGRFSKLKVLNGKLYFVQVNAMNEDELWALDLATAAAEPQFVMQVSGLVDYNESTVLYSDGDGLVWRAALGATLAAPVPEGSADGGLGDAAATAPVEPAGGAGELLLAERPWALSLFGDTVYFSNGDTVLRIGVEGGEATPLFPPDSFNYIASVGTDGTNVFFDNQDELTLVPAAGGEPRVLGVAGADSLFDDTARFVQFFSANDLVYWVDDGGTFGWTALDGQSCGVLGRFSSFFDAQGHLTKDSFFVGGDSGMYKVSRID